MDSEEKEKVIEDLLESAETIQGDLKIEGSGISRSKSFFFGTKSTQNVSGFACEKYDLQLFYKYRLLRKKRTPFECSY